MRKRFLRLAIPDCVEKGGEVTRSGRKGKGDKRAGAGCSRK